MRCPRINGDLTAARPIVHTLEHGRGADAGFDGDNHVGD